MASDELVDSVIPTIRQRFAENSSYKRILDPATAFTTHETSLHITGNLRPFLAVDIARRHPHGLIVIVAPTDHDAHAFVDEARSYWSENTQAIALLPSWETLPHERLSPRADTIAQRMSVFHRLAHADYSDFAHNSKRAEHGERVGSEAQDVADSTFHILQADSSDVPIRILVVPVRALIQPIISGLGDVEPLTFTQGGMCNLDEVVEKLHYYAYRRTDLVTERGDFAVRGGIIDIFVPTLPRPVRIELFGDEIDTIREFNVSDQRTFGDVLHRVVATPCKELLLTPQIRDRAAQLQSVFPHAETMLASISQGIPVEGMESLTPVLVDHLVSLTSLLPKRSLVMLLDRSRLETASHDLIATADEFLTASWHTAASGKHHDIPLDFQQANFQDLDATLEQLVVKQCDIWDCTVFGMDDEHTASALHVTIDPAPELHGKEAEVVQYVDEYRSKGYAIFFTASTQGALQRLQRMCNEYGIHDITIFRSAMRHGCVDHESKTVVLSDEDITGQRPTNVAYSTKAKKRRKAINLMELKPGDYVVHDSHGIGKFVQLMQRSVGSGADKAIREYLVLEYAPSKRNAPPDRLFVPTDQLHQVSKYIGAEVPKLNKLGGSDWAATKAKAKKHVAQIAESLVRLYSMRHQAQGFSFSKDTPWQRELEDAFPYQETPDQLTTIDEVKADMERAVPMDRLIAGDVGFGKTEIAVRAAFKAIQDGKQVALLVPTTLLVQQHFSTFSERYAPFPVVLKPLSRFQSAKEVRETLAGIEDGSVDMVIGTHKLLNPSVRFKNLGLVIIDEEQRFGVEHKETLKALKTHVDVLTMSATPIPRTLEMAVTGIREMSTLQTPPEDRLPVLTYVGRYEDAQVVASIKRELLRGGQVFYVHNRVQDITTVAAHLQELLPNANIAVAHGKMTEKMLDTVIRSFWNHEIDVLVCTTIIETGIDIANANTLIVDQADRYGLSQLHQLRGRVGRGRERAYAYFLYNPEKPLTQEAHDRLATIAEHTALGSGYDVAMKDLQLRGTGNLLGEEQSGHIDGVGFDLYVRLVSQAVEDYKRRKNIANNQDVNSASYGVDEETTVEAVSTTIDIPVVASIPSEYINSEKLRLEMYRKLAMAHDEEDFSALREECIDRYGAIPVMMESLFAVALLRNRAKKLGVAEVIAHGKQMRIAPIHLREAQQMRLQRVYSGTQYFPVKNMLVVPTPFQGELGGAPMNTEEILAWTNQLFDDITWHNRHRQQ